MNLTEKVMKIWITRHGQTDLNKKNLMQGRIDQPLNETGIEQAKSMRAMIGDIHFDAVYASPLDRAITTASIIGGIEKSEVIIDQRIIEADFGNYDCKKYVGMGVKMMLYWMIPEIFPAPATVESIASMVERSHSFLKELEEKDYENVLVTCHGGIIRALKGYLQDRPNGIKWRPKPKNCEIIIYESLNGHHKMINALRPE